MKVCPVCGKEFESLFPGKKYCSTDCYIINNRAVAKKKYKPKVHEMKACEICGTMFRPVNVNGKCCSDECRRESNKRRPRNWKEQQKQYRYCVVCGKRFESHRVDSACCSDSCKKKKYKAEEEGRTVRMSHIDDVERHARATGRRYADIQRQQTLEMIPKIDVNIGGRK